MAEILKTSGFEVVLGHDLNQQQFAQSIERYARILDDADVGLFFYAGHGLQMNDKNYLVSTNAKLDNEFLLSSEAIELDAIMRADGIRRRRSTSCSSTPAATIR